MLLWQIFATIGTVFLLLPFFNWQIIRWREKIKQKFALWHKKIIVIVFIISFLIALIFFLLALLY